MASKNGLKRLYAEAAGVYRIVRAYPATLLWPLLLLGLALGVGIWGVTRVTDVEERIIRHQARSLALSTSVWFKTKLEAAFSPVELMTSMVAYDPQYGAVSSLFAGLAPALMAQAPNMVTRLIEYVPNGVVQDIYPLTGNNKAAQGYDVFSGDERDGAVKSIKTNKTSLIGPIEFVEGGYGMIVRAPIIIQNVDANETFGIPFPANKICGAACEYNATSRTKFWGFAAALIDLEVLSRSVDSQLRSVEDLEFRYEILEAGKMTRIASSAELPTDPIEAYVKLDDNEWVIRISPNDGWRSSAYGGLVAGVVVAGVALSIMMFASLVSRKRYQMLLQALLPKEVIRDLHGTDTTALDDPILQARTTADLMLSMLSQLMEGYMPDLRDVVFVRQAIMRGTDLYQPLDLTQHICNANLDKDVARNLMQQLGQVTWGSFPDVTGEYPLSEEERGRLPLRAGQSISSKIVNVSLLQQQQQQQDYSTLSGALAIILTPQPTSLMDANDSISPETTFDTNGQQPRDIEVVATSSPRPSSMSFIGKAISFLRDGAAASNNNINSNTAISVRRVSMDLGNDQPAPSQSQLPSQTLRTPSALGGVYRPRASQDLPGGARSWSTMGDAPLESAVSVTAIVAATTVAEEAPGIRDEDRVSVQSACARDDSTLRTSVPVRRPPRKVASALGVVAPAANLRRRSLLQSMTNAAAVPAALAGPATIVGRRLSVASVFDGTNQAEGTVAEQGSGRLPLPLGASRRNLAAGPSRTVVVVKPQNMPPPPSVIEEVERLLSQADSWQFDTWRLRDATNGHPLSAMGFYLIQRAGLITHFNLKPAAVARLLRSIEAGYNDNPYHNATHAADVLQTLHVIIHGAQLHAHYLDHLGLLAAYFAAIVHDYGHPGLTNDFLVATSDPLAVRYNDRSPLENHHAAASFGLLQRAGMDILAPLSKADKAAFRKQVIEMVLATDIKQHFALLSQFSTVHRLASFSHNIPAERTGKHGPGRGSGAQHIELKEVIVDVNGSVHQAPRPVDETERLLSLQLAIKAADLGHLGEGLEVHKRWLASLEEEFFLQGDKERQLSIPISPLFDRSKQGVSKSQVGFYDFVALPLVHALSSAFPGAQPLMTCFLSNYNHWRVTDGQPPVSMPSPVCNTAGAAYD